MRKIFTTLCIIALTGVSTAHGVRNYVRASGTSASVPMKTVSALSAVNEDTAPQGDEKLFSTDWMCLMYDYIVDNSGIATRIRFSEDGMVYIHDLFSINQDYWVTASLKDNDIVIPLHQQVATSPDGKPLSLEVSTFKFSDDMMWSDIDRDATEYTLCGQADGSYRSSDIDKPWEERLYLVLCDENDGTHYLIGSIVSTPVESSVVTPPSGIAPEIFSFSYFGSGYQQAELINVVKDGDDIYVEGLCPALPDVWLKGEYINDGTQVAFRSGQFMDAEQYVHFFTAAHPNPAASVDNPEEPKWLKDDALLCDVAADGSIEFRTDRYLAVTIAGDVAYTIKPRTLCRYAEGPATPAKPIINELVWMEVDFLAFVQPTYDVKGMYINPANLSWRMYYDDELFTFETWEYYNLWGDTTQIPYGFDDNWDFMFYDDIGEQMVAIYKEGYRNIGIESVYSYDGKEYVSERAYFGQVTTGVENPATESKRVIETIFTDPAGRRVNNPSGGIYLRSDRYSDGTVKTGKVCVRQ